MQDPDKEKQEISPTDPAVNENPNQPTVDPGQNEKSEQPPSDPKPEIKKPTLNDGG